MLQRLTVDQLRAYQRRMEQTISSASDGVVADLHQLFGDFNKEFSRALAGPGRGIANKADATEFVEVAQTMSRLQTILDEAGLEDVVNGYRVQFQRITERTLQYSRFFNVEPSLRGIDAEALDAWIDFADRGLRTYVNKELVDPLRTALLQGLVGNRPREVAVNEILAISESLTPTQADTLVNDSFQRYHRFARTEQGKALQLDIVQYIGPDDGITRPACEFMLHWDQHGAPGFFYLDEVSSDLHPELEENPLVAGGGWNCRHDFFPVTLEYAMSKGFEPSRGELDGGEE